MAKVPKKRKATSSTGAPNDEETSNKKRTKASEKLVSLSDHDAAKQQFLDLLDSIESTSSADSQPVVMEASAKLLELRSKERGLYNRLNAVEATKQERMKLLEQKKLKLASLKFEKQFLEQQVTSCSNYKMPYLESICRQELDDFESPTEIVLEKFLCDGKPFTEMHESILRTLNQEINRRGNLERDTNQLKAKCEEKKVELNQKKKFVKELPKKLETMEKASLQLQNFFGLQNKIGTDRKKRLDLCKSLSGPIYNLFCQFQAHVDTHNDAAALEISRKKDGPSSVSLTFALPEASAKNPTKSNSGNKRVTVEFAHIEQHQVVVAKAFGAADKISTKVLLHNLFPNDDGSWGSDLVPAASGIPYHWCNYLAGFHFPSRTTDGSSTRAVMSQLTARVKSNAILTQLLLSLDKKQQIVTHESYDGSGTAIAKLDKFAKQDGAATDAVRTYTATIKSKASSKSKVTITVQVDFCQYPQVPPKWTFGDADDVKGLYDVTLASVETKVNTTLLKDFCEAEESKDYLLTHQLSFILQQQLFSDEAMSKPKQGRNRRGR